MATYTNGPKSLATSGNSAQKVVLFSAIGTAAALAGHFGWLKSFVSKIRSASGNA